MSAEKLKKVALTQFALHGYDGASLALIANDVGIKKQSIYAHFKSKEDLFLNTFEDSVKKEIAYINRYIEGKQSDSLASLLQQFLRDYLKRYKENDNTSFFIRTSFFPPIQLEEKIKKGTNVFVSEQETIFLKIFEKHRELLQNGISPESAMLCFLTMMDGLFVEMLYGAPERLEKRTIAVWDVYSQILNHSIEEGEKNEK